MYHHIYESSMETRVLDMLSAHQTDAEFRAQKERRKILHDCKQKGFPMLRKLNLISHEQKRKMDVRNEIQKFSDEKRKEILNQICELIKGGERHEAACKKVGMNIRTVRGWAKKFNVELPRNQMITQSIQFEIMDRVNAGESVRAVSKELGVTAVGVKYALARRGYKYEYDKVKRIGKFIKEV